MRQLTQCQHIMRAENCVCHCFYSLAAVGLELWGFESSLHRGGGRFESSSAAVEEKERFKQWWLCWVPPSEAGWVPSPAVLQSYPCIVHTLRTPSPFTVLSALLGIPFKAGNELLPQ